jgi:phenylacetate-CoA ligase
MSQNPLYNPKYETLSRDEIEQFQIERLQSTLNRVYRNVAFYRTAFDTHGVNLEQITDLRALQRLPFTTREDLWKSYPYDMFAVPLRDIVRIHSTSGIAGKPIVVGYTRNDLKNWTECAARLLTAAGVNEHDVVQIALDYHLFSGGFGFHQGAEQIGASVIPASSSANIAKQIIIMRDFKTSTLITTPSHAANIIVGLEELQVHPERLRLRLALLSGEQCTDSLRRRIEDRLHLLSIDTYGPTEIMGPGVAGECHLRNGLHVNEDHFIVEVIDPKTLEPVAPGEKGEIVFTTLGKEGFPLIRYRTGDISSLDLEPCGCGRTFLRMARIRQRTDDMIFFQGVGFFPALIEEILSRIEGASSHFQIILDQQNGVDTLEIQVEVSNAIPSLDEIKTLESLRNYIAQCIKTEIEVDAKVMFVVPKALRSPNEPRQRVIDRR